MSKIYLVTGAAGHLGGTLVSMLVKRGDSVRALALQGDKAAETLPKEAKLFYGDVTDKASLYPFFDVQDGYDVIVIHAAGIVSIASKYSQAVHDVNVMGTKNVTDVCRERNVKKLVYVSSVHAIPTLPAGETMTEIKNFDPGKVEGLYAKTKAEATAYVLSAVSEGLDASVVHPSGIAGPGDNGHGHITQLLIDYYRGSLTAGVSGGYDFVDVRDVAAGILSCCELGRRGECYILSNRYFSIKELFGIFHKVTGKHKIKNILPIWLAKLVAPLAEVYYKILRQPPLYTAYSIYTLSGNAAFSHEKAEKELFYTVRPFEETVADTVKWLKLQNRLPEKKQHTHA